MHAALSLGKYLWLESQPNLKNLTPDERSKVKALMSNLSQIASQKENSPMTAKEADAILTKLQNAKRMQPKSGLVARAFKKATGPLRVTVDDLQKAKTYMESTIEGNEKLKATLLNTIKPKELATFTTTDILHYIDNANGLDDAQQAVALAECLKEKTHISVADVQANKQEWLAILRAINTLEASGPKSKDWQKKIIGFILAKLAASGSLDEQFAKEWRAGKYGPKEEYQHTFNECMAASLVINGKTKEVSWYLDDQENSEKTQQILDAMRDKSDANAIATLKKQLDSWSNTPAS